MHGSKDFHIEVDGASEEKVLAGRRWLAPPTKARGSRVVSGLYFRIWKTATHMGWTALRYKAI